MSWAVRWLCHSYYLRLLDWNSLVSYMKYVYVHVIVFVLMYNVFDIFYYLSLPPLSLPLFR